MSDQIEKSETSSGVLTPVRHGVAGQKGLILLIVGILILVAVVVFLFFTIFSSSSAGSSFYAVFLTNGRTYFGHIAKQNSNILVLRDVYYLQVQQLEPTEEGVQPQPQLSLVNVSDELHAPESEMTINWAHVLFLQKLQKESQVVSTIEQLDANR